MTKLTDYLDEIAKRITKELNDAQDAVQKDEKKDAIKKLRNASREMQELTRNLEELSKKL